VGVVALLHATGPRSPGASAGDDAAAAGSPRAAVLALASALREDAPDADRVRSSLLLARYGVEETSAELYGDVKGLFRALRASHDAPTIADASSGGAAPHRHAVLRVTAGGASFEALLVEEDGWKLARVTAEAASPEGGDAAAMGETAGAGAPPPASPAPAKPKEDLFDVATAVLTAIDVRDAKAFGERFVDARDAAAPPRPVDPPALDRALSALHEKYGGRPRRLGAAAVREWNGRSVHAVPFALTTEAGEVEAVAWLCFVVGEDGKASLADVQDGEVSEFKPR
jgi:hypothetical protein